MEDNKEPKSDGQQIADAGKTAMNVGKSAVNAGKAAIDNTKKAIKMARKAMRMAIKAARMAMRLARHAISLLIKLCNPYVAAIVGGVLLVIVLVIIVYLTTQYAGDKLAEIWNNMFPGTYSSENGSSSSSNSNSDIVEAAKSVHQVLEENGYSYGGGGSSPNYYQTVEESTDAGNRQVDCSTYVAWVLARINIKMPTRVCGNGMKTALEGESWCESIGMNPSDAKTGDLVLYSGHVQIYGGADNAAEEMWYDAGGNESIQNPAPSSGYSTPWSGSRYNEFIGIFRVKT